MLGTGNALVTKCYNTCFTIHTPQTMLLVDAGGGNGILAQLEKAAIKLDDVHHIFITHEKSHVTVKDAAENAEPLGVKNLVIYHTEDKNITHRKELYTAEAELYYRGNVFVPEDLETIEL